jgi:DNA-dependent RNA polymerase auxiliary subunit epsilon
MFQPTQVSKDESARVKVEEENYNKEFIWKEKLSKTRT